MDELKIKSDFLRLLICNQIMRTVKKKLGIELTMDFSGIEISAKGDRYILSIGDLTANVSKEDITKLITGGSNNDKA